MNCSETIIMYLSTVHMKRVPRTCVSELLGCQVWQINAPIFTPYWSRAIELNTQVCSKLGLPQRRGLWQPPNRDHQQSLRMRYMVPSVLALLWPAIQKSVLQRFRENMNSLPTKDPQYPLLQDDPHLGIVKHWPEIESALAIHSKPSILRTSTPIRSAD